VIADHTAYDVRYTGKLSDLFRLQIKCDPIQRVEFIYASKLYLLKRDY